MTADLHDHAIAAVIRREAPLLVRALENLVEKITSDPSIYCEPEDQLDCARAGALIHWLVAEFREEGA